GFSAKLNLYRTSYMDEAFNEAIPHGTTDLYTVDVSGVNELHQGAELELKLQPIRDITINGMFSYGDWYYTSNAGPATEYNAQQQVVGSIDHVDLKGIKNGDAAQTTAHLGIDVKVLPQIKIGADYFYWGNYTSRFDFTQADSPDLHPWKVPNVSIWNLDAIFSFKIANYDAQLVGNIQNLLNTKYISDSYDAALSGNPNNVSVFYAAGRTFTTSLKIKF
ncbi:MAG TPA: TonB-dependent receptor, partial [Mucilaginibacter sp.]